MEDRARQAHHATSFPFLAKGVGRGELGDLTSPPERLRTASQLRDSAGLAPASPKWPRRQTASGHSHRLNALWLSSRGPGGRRDTSVALARIRRPVRPLRACQECWRAMSVELRVFVLRATVTDPRRTLERYNQIHPFRLTSLSVSSTEHEMSDHVALSRTQQLISKLAPRSWV